MTNAVAINRQRLRIKRQISDIETIRLTIENNEQTGKIKEAISCIQMAEDWLKDELKGEEHGNGNMD